MHTYRQQSHQSQARSQTFLWGGQIGQILGPFMIMRGLSCDRVGFGHFGGGHMTPLTPTLATGLQSVAGFSLTGAPKCTCSP